MKAGSQDLPDSAVVEEFISKVVRPILETIGHDTGRRLEMKVAVMQGISEAIRLGVVSVGNEKLPVLHGSMRLRFRAAFGGRWLMHCEALFDRTDSINNCSGFSMKAELKEGAAKRTAWTMRYGVWDWTG